MNVFPVGVMGSVQTNTAVSVDCTRSGNPDARHRFQADTSTFEYLVHAFEQLLEKGLLAGSGIYEFLVLRRSISLQVEDDRADVRTAQTHAYQEVLRRIHVQLHRTPADTRVDGSDFAHNLFVQQFFDG